MDDPRVQMSRLMRRVRSGQIPPSESIVAETFERLGLTTEKIDPRKVLDGFNDLLRLVWEQTLPTLESYEEEAYSTGIPREFITEFPAPLIEAEKLAADDFRAAVMRLFQGWYPSLRRAFQSVAQSRMTRGGKDFELQIEQLLRLANIPFDKQERRNRTDLVLPSAQAYDQNRTVAAIVSVKRTLRERWAEVAEELFNLRSPNVFLFTADENVTAGHVERICDGYNIHLVVWDSVKNDKYPDNALVLGYGQWAQVRLPQLIANWPN